ncbi:peptidoglycan-binding protein [Nitratifractor sp.]|uniref:peptidoglycan-binding domain-containing protein n=1 Tax=Nitratifractor sp. TaxID=2268144 RepID=UPI0025FE238C|nr:peptidoglycan-binding protein [Nitratifractor sp.]
MKRLTALATAVLMTAGGVESLEAGFGDAVAGGIVGGVVGSVITNEIYHSGRHRHYRHRVVHRRPAAPVMTDEMRIQQALKNLGYYRGPIDGQINSFVTRNAIKEFNRAYEIGDTAYMSPQERDALIYLGNLLELDRQLTASGNDRRSKTRRIQAALKVLGFYNGKVDGSTGPMTRRAIAEYRRANGLPAGYTLGYEDEYRLIDTAKRSNDNNIQETIASLKRLGAASAQQPYQPRPASPAARQPVILQPAPAQAPVQPAITQEAPAPMAPAPAPQPVQGQQTPQAVQPSAPSPVDNSPASQQPAQNSNAQ